MREQIRAAVGLCIRARQSGAGMAMSEASRPEAGLRALGRRSAARRGAGAWWRGVSVAGALHPARDLSTRPARATCPHNRNRRPLRACRSIPTPISTALAGRRERTAFELRLDRPAGRRRSAPDRPRDATDGRARPARMAETMSAVDRSPARVHCRRVRLMWRQWIPFWQPGELGACGAMSTCCSPGCWRSAFSSSRCCSSCCCTFAIRYRAGKPMPIAIIASRKAGTGRSAGRPRHWCDSSHCLSGARICTSTSTTCRSDALPIYVVAKQWMWKVQHPGGQREINELHIPVDAADPADHGVAGRDPLASSCRPSASSTTWCRAATRTCRSGRAQPASIICSAPNTAAPIIRA